MCGPLNRMYHSKSRWVGPTKFEILFSLGAHLPYLQLEINQLLSSYIDRCLQVKIENSLCILARLFTYPAMFLWKSELHQSLEKYAHALRVNYTKKCVWCMHRDHDCWCLYSIERSKYWPTTAEQPDCNAIEMNIADMGYNKNNQIFSSRTVGQIFDTSVHYLDLSEIGYSWLQ